MHKILNTILLMAILPLAGGHVLTKLWQNYNDAERADRPKEQMKALESIKKEARAKHLAWDFYDACTRYVDVAASVNWKLRDSLRSRCTEEIEAFGEPVVEYFYKERGFGGESGWNPGEFISEKKKKLLNSRNPDFWEADWALRQFKFGDWLKKNLSNDYEYALWSQAGRSDGSAMSELEKYFAGAYPMGALVEFQQAQAGYHRTPEEERLKSLERIRDKYAGKAVAFLAEDEILQIRFDRLSRDEENGTSGNLSEKSKAFRQLRDDCKSFEERRKALKDKEKDLAACSENAGYLIETLESSNVRVSVSDGVACILMTNTAEAELRVKHSPETGKDSGKQEVFSKTISNEACSFFVPDSVKLELPELPDGEYEVECIGTVKGGAVQGRFSKEQRPQDECEYSKYTISLAIRKNSDGLGIWATDYLSGEPLGSVEAIVTDRDGKQVESARINIDGFSPLPDKIGNLLGDVKGRYSLRVKSGSRLSEKITAYRAYVSGQADEERRNCVIITDRRAFNPDESVKFSALVYYGQRDLRPAGKGEKYKAVLKDSEAAIIESKTLSTNEFGSINGEFKLPRRQKNGWYNIHIEDKDGRTIAGASVLVDDFVLPSFDLVFEDPGELWLPMDKVVLKGSARAYSGHSLAGAKTSWIWQYNGEEKDMGPLDIDADGHFEIEVPINDKDSDWQWHSVRIRITDASGETQDFGKGFSLRKKPEPVKKTSYYFEDLGGDGLALKVVAGERKTWVLWEIYGSGELLLDRGIRVLTPSEASPEAQKLKAQAEGELRFGYRAEWPDAICLKVIYFQNKNQYSYTLNRRREDHRYDLPLEFSRFTDLSAPGQPCSIGIKTGAEAEIALSIFDKSTERFAANHWQQLRAIPVPAPSVGYNYRCGSNDSRGSFGPIRVMGARGMNTMMMKSAAMDAAPMAYAQEEAVAETADDMAVAGSKAMEENVLLREDFATTIAWEPALRSDASGNAEFSWRNADKLSTFYVQLFAHDKKMRNAVLRKEMTVSIPVKVSLAQPQFLFSGDKYIVRAALANSLKQDVRGTLSLSFFDGEDHRKAAVLGIQKQSVSIKAGSSTFENFEFDVPEGIGALGVKAVFIPDAESLSGSSGSDAVFVSIPVFPAEQSFSEAHSAVLLAGADRSALEKSLRAMFVNIPGDQAVLREISIRKMLEEAVPKEVTLRSDNAIDLARALYAESLCKKIGAKPEFNHDEAVAKLLSCSSDDGGFSWFPGMDPSPRVTLIVASRLRGLGIIDEAAAVKFIDKYYFEKDRNYKRIWWYIGISMEEYLHFRSLFPEVGFSEKPDADFRKAARKYLVPGKTRGLNGAILSKARRMLSLRNFLYGPDGNEGAAGIALAKKMGIRLAAAKKMKNSLAADVESLLQYAQPHKQGGIYYPNAVMPWRGLLESELYAHSLLCNLLSACGHEDVADGIRLWMMLQKETQHWESDPGYIEAIASVLEASEAVLNTNVLALEGSWHKPFGQILPAGNGMSISGPASPASVSIGGRIKLSWKLYSGENRSFVKVSLPIPAGLQPVDQRSGYRWGYYRNVLKDRIEYWYESYPEETIEVSEEFYAVRAGHFQHAAPSIECLYAPHYQANASPGKMRIFER